MALKDITGQRFGRLTVIRQDGWKHNSSGRLAAWLCQCDCGGTKTIVGSSLRGGYTRSCGCAFREWASKPKTHGKTHTPEYQTYHAMKKRCMNRSGKDFAAYGERGIKVCERWLNGGGGLSGFECFLADMGEKPTPQHSIDRIDSNGNYEPSNCRWATPATQSRNRKYVRLSPELVCEIRGHFGHGRSACWISRKYGISDTHVRRVVRREVWANIP